MSESAGATARAAATSTRRRVWRRLTHLAALGVAAAVAGAALPGIAHAADLQANPSNLSSVFDAAQTGDRILLASGSYGTFRGALKPGNVTLTPLPGASVTMALSFAPAANITIDGIGNITSAYLSDSQTKNITVRNSYFSGQTQFRTGSLANAGILFEGNTHGPWDACSGCNEARMWFPERTSQPSGITIRNSTFGPGGNSDGIQNGSYGTVIEGNTFLGIHQRSGDSVHADSIQLYGSRGTVIRRNFFYDVSDCVLAADGLDHEVIEDNVCVQDGIDAYAFNLKSDDGSVINHNTLAPRNAKGSTACAYNTPCGTMWVGNKSADDAGRNTVLTNNVMAQVVVAEGSQTYANESYNLFSAKSRGGLLDLLGQPVFQGGLSPATYAGFMLSPLSPGAGTASDGLDRGARIGSGSPAPPPPEPSPDPSPTPDIAAQAIWTAPTGAETGTAVTLDGTASQGDAPIACTWSFENQDGSTIWDTATGCRLSKTFTSADTKYVKLIVKDADGDTDADKQSFAVTAPTAPAPPPDVAAQAIWTAPTGVRVGRPVTFDGTASKGDPPLQCTWTFENQSGAKVSGTAYGCTIQKTFTRTQTVYVRLAVRDADGDAAANRQRVAVTK